MKSHERREVDHYSASWWLLKYPQITKRSQKSLAIEQTLLFMELFPAELLKSKFRIILLIATVNMPTIISFIPGKTHIIC